MPKYLIERNIPGIECMGASEIKAIARRSNSVLADLGSEIKWLHSYVVNGKTYCVYISPDEELIREHARITGFPCNKITLISQILDPGLGKD